VRSMNAMIIGWLAVGCLVLAPGCSGKCKNPKIVESVDWKTKQPITGPGMQCHVVDVCKQPRGADSRTPVSSSQDPVIVDYGSATAPRCVEAAKLRLEVTDGCHFEAAPEPICLDVASTGGGPDYTGPTGGTLITVGVGSGDYYRNSDGTAGGGGLNDGTAGGGGLGGEAGAGGQGGN